MVVLHNIIRKVRKRRILLILKLLSAIIIVGYIFPELQFRVIVSLPCKFPEPADLHQYHQSFREILKPTEDVNCSKLFPSYFESTFDSELVPTMTVDQFHAHQIKSCCYYTISRNDSDYNFTFSELCHPISLELKTMVHKSHEFIAIFCGNKTGIEDDPDLPHLIASNITRPVDVLAFVPLKPEVEQRLDNIGASGDRPNVIFLGMDGISRAHFRRLLPKAHIFLAEKLGAIEMQGFHKMGRNTLPNLSLLLTSQTLGSLRSTCITPKAPFDACHFIWKDFAQKGYRTAFSEDSMWGTFSVRYNGFRIQPTDYYLRTYIQVVSKYFQTKKISVMNMTTCTGPRLSYEGMLSHIRELSYKMNHLKRPFFYFSWETTLTHESFNEAALAEEPLWNTLKWMKDNDQLNNTILIVFSDHGIRNTLVNKFHQARIEGSLPVLYLFFPEWFKRKYPRAMDNVNRNKERLTTPLDLNYALQDILNMDRIRDDVLQKREEKLVIGSAQGVSLFLPIPPNRTCTQALIEPNFCICTLIRRTVKLFGTRTV